MCERFCGNMATCTSGTLHGKMKSGCTRCCRSSPGNLKSMASANAGEMTPFAMTRRTGAKSADRWQRLWPKACCRAVAGLLTTLLQTSLVVGLLRDTMGEGGGGGVLNHPWEIVEYQFHFTMLYIEDFIPAILHTLLYLISSFSSLLR